jgi:hypothetical protein
VTTTVINAVLFQTIIDWRSGERIEVSGGQLERISDVTEEENREPTTLPLIDPRVGLMLIVYCAS